MIYLPIVVAGFFNLVMIFGYISWFYLFLVLLQLMLCKDATQPNTSKLLHRPLKVRLRLFKRSLHDRWYLASFGVLIGVCIIIYRLTFEFIYNVPKSEVTIMFHGVFPSSLGYLYYLRGYRAIFFVKLGEFLKGHSD